MRLRHVFVSTGSPIRRYQRDHQLRWTAAPAALHASGHVALSTLHQIGSVWTAEDRSLRDSLVTRDVAPDRHSIHEGTRGRRRALAGVSLFMDNNLSPFTLPLQVQN